MSVTVRLPSILVRRTNERNLEADGATFREILDCLDERYPGLKGDISVDGKLRSSLILSVDGLVVSGPNALDTPTPAGTVIEVDRVISGG